VKQPKGNGINSEAALCRSLLADFQTRGLALPMRTINVDE